MLKNIFTIGGVTVASFAIWAGTLYIFNLQQSRLVFGLVLSLLTLAVLVAILRWIDKKPINFMFGSGSAPQAFGKGMAYFLVPALLALAVCLVLGIITITPTVDAGTLSVTILSIAGLVFLSEALPEELIFRGYIFKKLSLLLKQWAVIVIQAALFLLFAFVIGAVESPLDASFLATFAIVLGVLRSATGSVWGSIGFHLAAMTTLQSFGANWSIFTVSNPQLLQMFVLGIIPFSVTIAVLFSKVQWLKKQS